MKLRVTLAALGRIVMGSQPTLLRSDKAPNLIYLNPLAGQIAHGLVHQGFAALADANQQAADLCPGEPGHALGGRLIF